jgi:hypothetical protein
MERQRIYNSILLLWICRLLCIEQNQSAYIFFRKSDFFFLSICELHCVLPYHALNSEVANFETPCVFYEYNMEQVLIQIISNSNSLYRVLVNGWE